MTARKLLAAVLLVLGALQLPAVPGYYTPWAALAAAALGSFLLVAGYLVFPGTSGVDSVPSRVR